MRKGCLLDVVLSPRTATKCVAAGWIYSIIIAILIISLIPENDEFLSSKIDSCLHIMSPSYNVLARTLLALSILSIILAVAIIQFFTFWKLHKRLNNSVGCVTNQGLNHLFKRAMIKSALVAGTFSICWGPCLTLVVLTDWSVLNTLQYKNTMGVLFALAFLQGFCNALIFRAKHIKAYVEKRVSCR